MLYLVTVIKMAHPIKHFRTITRHRHRVIAHCRKAGILWQGLRHDLSKYSPTEFVPGARFYQGTRSPNERERELYGCSCAWLHHKGRNRHHYEYWNDYNPVTKNIENVEMPLRYVAEMFCDRVAASKIYKGDKYTDKEPYIYFLRIKGKNRMHPNTERLLCSLLEMLRDEGEEKTFAHLKKMIKTEKKQGREKKV